MELHDTLYLYGLIIIASYVVFVLFCFLQTSEAQREQLSKAEEEVGVLSSMYDADFEDMRQRDTSNVRPEIQENR